MIALQTTIACRRSIGWPKSAEICVSWVLSRKRRKSPQPKWIFSSVRGLDWLWNAYRWKANITLAHWWFNCPIIKKVHVYWQTLIVEKNITTFKSTEKFLLETNVTTVWKLFFPGLYADVRMRKYFNGQVESFFLNRCIVHPANQNGNFATADANLTPFFKDTFGTIKVSHRMFC